ncbi:MarR family transcriptional regulator [Aquimarina sp. TRL1]|uniref:bifunctional helix-turn-helix transcriptional regulator/GNAT family N-acetyltransferase n=1 Tax=Aquimarina sp. (strain TRL1) TaxID=2736252 RepID=UPI00158F2237|nr:bifunctional helix-turn-helix transcriptional regulator/GNAT family N-acetyltransferase [Aquimarina sp. TRL1]QKX04194.1 MarR family transcriptional regulator [Aquimarina sp. TRL1]
MDHLILREIGKIYRSINTFVDFLYEPLDLKKGQYQFLTRIYEHPGINQQTLSAILLLDKTTVSKAVSKLIQKGYIKKQTNPEDKRNVLLYLTDKGEKTCSFLIRNEQFISNVSNQGFSEEEYQHLLSQLKKMNNNVLPLFQEAKKRDREQLLKRIDHSDLMRSSQKTTVAIIDIHHPLYESERNLRNKVLLRPIGLPDHAWEKKDAISWHFVAVKADKVIGCFVLVPLNTQKNKTQLIQMAVDTAYQGKGIGKLLIDTLKQFCRENQIEEVCCHARETAIDFYKKSGFSIYGTPFEEVGLKHRHMRIRFNKNEWNE